MFGCRICLPCAQAGGGAGDSVRPFGRLFCIREGDSSGMGADGDAAREVRAVGEPLTSLRLAESRWTVERMGTVVDGGTTVVDGDPCASLAR